jgi:zinc protease
VCCASDTRRGGDGGELQRPRRLAEGEEFDPTPEKIEARVKRLELAEGIKVTLLPKKSRGEEARLTLTLRYGSEDTLKGLEPAAGFLSDLMLRGTKKLSYQQFRDELDRLGATLGAGFGGGGRRGGGRRGGGGGGGVGSLSFSVQARHDTMPAVLEILRQVLREPLLPKEEFEIMKRERVANLEQTKTEPATLAPRLLQQVLNPYSNDDIPLHSHHRGIHRAREVRHLRAGHKNYTAITSAHRQAS